MPQIRLLFSASLGRPIRSPHQMPPDAPCVAPSTFPIRRMVLPHGQPVEAVPPDFSGKDTDAGFHIPLRIKQFLRRYSQFPEPLVVDLHQANVIGLFPGLRPADILQGLPDAARMQIPPLDVERQRVQGGFLPGYGNGQLTRNARAGARFCEHIARAGNVWPPCHQAEQQHFFHLTISLVMAFQSTVCW